MNIQIAAASADDGLVGAWHLDEGIGSTASDSSGYGNDGTLSGGKFGNALYFDGADDGVEVVNSPSLNILGSIALEAWVKIDEFPSGRDLVVAKSGAYALQVSEFGKVRVFLGNWVSFIQTDSVVLTTGIWYHIAGTYDGSFVRIFVNGVMEKEVANTGPHRTSSSNVWIGDFIPTLSGGDGAFKGIIDEVRISTTPRYTASFSVPTAAFAPDAQTAALWHFDESVGITAYDSSGNANDGTIYGATWAGPTWTTGLFGSSLHFDGIDDYARVLGSASLSGITSQMTVEAWLNFEDVRNAFYVRTPYDSGLAGGLDRWGGLLRFHIYDGGVYKICSIAWTPVTGTWYHLAGTYDGTSLKLFVNGALVETFAYTGDIDSTSEGVVMGARYSYGGADFHKGLIDEVRVWNKALAVEEIKKHAWGLVGEWLFDEGAGSIAYDTSGFTHDGTLVGSPTWSDGKVGQALTFDGSSYVDLGIEVDDVIQDGVTLEAWIKPAVKQNGGILSSDITDSSKKGFDFFLWSAYDPYGRIYIDCGAGASRGRKYWTIPSMEWYDNWHHVAATWDGATIKLYVDGADVGTLAFSGEYAEPGKAALIGAINYLAVRYHFVGTIDEVRIWNKALVPISFGQTGLNTAAEGELVVTVSDPIPLDYEDLPFVMMVPAGAEVTYNYEEMIEVSSTEGFTLIDVTGPDSPVTVNEATFVTGNYFEWATVSGTKYDSGDGFCDDFESYELGADGSPTWIADTGTWQVVEDIDVAHNQVYYGKLVGRAFSNINAETHSMIITTDFKALASSSPTGWANGFIVFDYEDSDNFKRAGLGVGDPRYIIDCYVGGARVESLEISAPGIVRETWYSLMAEIDGDMVYLYVDGEFKAQHTFSDPIGNGKVGVETGTAESYFDNFCFRPKVETLESWRFILKDEYEIAQDDFTTGSNGQYTLVAKYPGTYSVYEEVKDGWTLVYPQNVANQYGPAEYFGYEVTVESGDAINGIDFWNFEWAAVTAEKLDTEGQVIEGWNVYVDNEEGTTGSDGRFTFVLKQPGIYTVTEEDRAGWTPIGVTNYKFTAESGGIYGPYTFTNFKNFKVSGVKSEYGKTPLSGWTIQLFKDPDWVTPIATTITEETTGYYEFTITAPGVYRVYEVLQSDWAQIIPASPGYYEFTATSGREDIVGQNFVNFKWLTVSGYKYEDIDGFCDDFEDGTLDEWFPVAGDTSWSISSGVLRCNPAVTYPLIKHDVSFDDYVFEADARVVSGRGYALIFRVSADSQQFYSFQYQVGTGYQLRLYQFTSFPSGIDVADQINYPTDNAWHHLKVAVSGDHIKCYVDGVLVYDVIDSTAPILSAGDVGFRTWASTTAEFDNVCVMDISTPLEGWTMNLYKDGSFVATEDTDSSGYYEFTVKEPGEYSIKEVLQDGWTAVKPTYKVYTTPDEEVEGYTFTATSGKDVRCRDFWNFKWTSLSGYKFFDAGGDGVNDDEPGLENWRIELYKDGSLYGEDTTDASGYYEIQIKDPGIYTATEVLLAPWWERTTDDYTFAASSGEPETCDFGNWLGPSWVSTSALCNFDVDDADGQQFRIIFTPDIANDPNLYKVSATNPGQFYYNVFFSGELTEGFTITLPDDFETQGANPVHVYSSLNTGPLGCLVPGEDVSDRFEINIEGKTITVSPLDDYSGFLYINVHCDYAMKKTGGYELQYYYDDEGIIRGNAINSESIMDMAYHEFSVAGAVDGTVEIQNRNEFKKFRGIVGFLTDAGSSPISGVSVTITGPSIDSSSMPLTTDEDGFYGYSFFHKGKPATYMVEFEEHGQTTVEMKAGRFAEASFQVS